MTKNREAIIESIATHLRTAVEMGSEVDPYYTPEMVLAAQEIIDLRKTFLTRAGEPDILGKSYAYRQAFGDTMTRAGLAGVDRNRVGSSLRYHIGNLLRESMTPEEVADLGLVKSSPRETSKKSFERRSKMWRGLNEESPGPVTDPVDAVEALLAMSSMLGRISVDWASASLQQRQVAELAAKSIAEAAQTVAG